VQEPQKGSPGGSALRCRSGWTGRRLIETLRRRRIRRVIARTREARERRPGEVRVQGFRRQALEGQSPGKAPAVVGIKPRAVARHFREVRTQKPGPVGPV
jgi:hypothetical protein